MEIPEQRPVGADLLFLSEFPIGVLSDRPPDVESVVFELKERPGKRKGKQWMISAGAGLGLPNYVDMQLFILLLAYTKQQGCPDQIHFCRHQILQDLGWTRGEANYARVQLGLDRLIATTYRAINHYPDPKGRDCVQRIAFHLMDRYEIHDSRYADAQLPPSWFRWSDDIRRLLHTRQLKTLDLELFRTLKRPVTQAMYRYLHTRHMDGKATFEENLVEYACERLGLSREFRWLSDLKRTLDAGHRELIERGLINSVNYERMRAEKGERAQQKVVIHYSTPPAPPPAADCALSAEAKAGPSLSDHLITSSPHHPISPLVERLTEAGITRAIAEELVARCPEVVETQLDYWPHRDPAKYQNPAGALVKAIERNWAAPEAWRRLQRRQEREATQRERRAQETDHEARTAAENAAFDAWWSSLPTAEQASLTAEAKAELFADSPTIAQHYQRHPDRLQEALRPLLLRRMP
jgi:replication initiator protein A